jgi:hypothetical protein
MTHGEWRGCARWGAIGVLTLAIAAGCGTSDGSDGEPATEETVAYGASGVLKAVPAPPPDAALEEVPDSLAEAIACARDGRGGRPPGPWSPPVNSPANEMGRLVRFWTIDRFSLDSDGSVRVRPRFHKNLLAKAKPDECFNGVGQQYGAPDANGACELGEPKVNDSYVWGLTMTDGKVFFGTLSNTLCGVERGYLEMVEPQLYDEYVCEFGSSVRGSDSRPPNMFMYDTATDALVSLNPDPVLAATADRLRKATGGLRSAANHDGVVFLAGSGASGLNMFAFDAATGALVGNGATIGGSSCLTATAATVTCPVPGMRFNNVRQWAVAKGHLYLGVGMTKPASGGNPAVNAGAVLRWVGDLANPYQFVAVGILPADAANMIAHTDGRLYITTWPYRAKGDPTVGADGKILGVPAGLYRSPVIPEVGGLPSTPEAIDDPTWSTPLWLATFDGDPAHAKVPAYDPDRMAGLHTGGGALVSFKGRVYFGTMTVPMYGVQDATETYETPPADFLRTWLGAHRPIALFEVKLSKSGAPNVTMIVGEKYLPTYDPAAGGYSIRYDKAHRTGFNPRWAPSGFGNFFNTYTWAMRVFRNQVFVGTMDWSQLARINMQAAFGDGTSGSDLRDAFLRALGNGFPREGADLLRFSDSDIFAESVNGVGNDRNYGVRNMVTDGNALYIGTANPMNLDPAGGWELIRLW